MKAKAKPAPARPAPLFAAPSLTWTSTQTIAAFAKREGFEPHRYEGDFAYTFEGGGVRYRCGLVFNENGWVFAVFLDDAS